MASSPFIELPLVLLVLLVLLLLVLLVLLLVLVLLLELLPVPPPREQIQRKSGKESHILSAARLPSPRYSSPFPPLSDRCLS